MNSYIYKLILFNWQIKIILKIVVELKLTRDEMLNGGEVSLDKAR